MLINVEQLKTAHPISEVLESRGVRVRLRGKVLVCQCPLHAETHGASFTIWQDENRWRCFGKCDAGGDVIDLVSKLDSLSFLETCERLGGERVGITAHQSPATEIPKHREPLALSVTPGQVSLMHAAVRALADSPAKCEAEARRRGWQADTVRGLAMEGSLGLHEDKLAFLYDHGMKLRWRDTQGERLRLAGREVVLALDADEAGEKAAERIARELAGVAARVCRVNIKEILEEPK